MTLGRGTTGDRGQEEAGASVPMSKDKARAGAGCVDRVRAPIECCDCITRATESPDNYKLGNVWNSVEKKPVLQPDCLG